jgi:DNA-binding NarL/FixJ family response regulator
MRHNSTLARQSVASDSRAEPLEECVGNILFLDEQHFTRDCIARELERRLPEFKIIEGGAAREVVEQGLGLAKLDLIILYVHADRMNLKPGHEDTHQNGIATQLSLLEHMAPDTPRVLMSEIEVPEDILEAFRRHVRGYVPTTLPMKQVAEALRFVAAGGTFVPQSVLSMHGHDPIADQQTHDMVTPEELTDFSPRQNEVLRMLWNGCSNKVIAYELHMSESTVKVHIRHIMKKLNVNNRTQVVLRTRPLRLDTDAWRGRPAPPSSLETAKAIISLADGRPVAERAVAHSLTLSK